MWVFVFFMALSISMLIAIPASPLCKASLASH